MKLKVVNFVKSSHKVYINYTDIKEVIKEGPDGINSLRRD